MTGMTAARPVRGLPAKRAGFDNWRRGFGSMLRWELTSMRLLLPLTVIVQMLLGAGFVLGIGLFFDDIPPRSAVFLSTGAGVVTLITVGLVMGPQLVALQKQAGTYDFMWSLPVPRSAASAAWVTLNIIIAVPGLIAALVVAAWRYQLDFDVTWEIVPAVLATLVTGTLLGYALAHGVPKPEVTLMISQLLIFVIVGFSPINYPPEHLPSWLADTHDYLPFAHMAGVVRSGLTEGLIGEAGRSYVVLAAWALVALAVTIVVLRRRR